MSIFYECKQMWCKPRFCFWYKCFLTKMQMQFSWCRCPCRDENAKFIHDDASAHIYTMMQISPCRDGDAKILGCKCLLMGMSWCECPLVSMPWCECSNPNTNYSKISFIFKIRFSRRLKPKNWWSLLEIPKWGIDLEFDDLAQKIYFHNLVEQKGGTFKVFFF